MGSCYREFVGESLRLGSDQDKQHKNKTCDYEFTLGSVCICEIKWHATFKANEGLAL